MRPSFDPKALQRPSMCSLLVSFWDRLSLRFARCGRATRRTFRRKPQPLPAAEHNRTCDVYWFRVDANAVWCMGGMPCEFLYNWTLESFLAAAAATTTTTWEYRSQFEVDARASYPRLPRRAAWIDRSNDSRIQKAFVCIFDGFAHASTPTQKQRQRVAATM